jgi:hypothetical protein
MMNVVGGRKHTHHDEMQEERGWRDLVAIKEKDDCWVILYISFLEEDAQ